MLISEATLDQLANLIADRVAVKLANRPKATDETSLPTGALSKKNAASYLGVSTRTVEKYIASGQLRPVKHGVKVTLRITDLDSFIKGMQKG